MERLGHVSGTPRTGNELGRPPGGAAPSLHPLSPFPVVPGAEPLDRLLDGPLELGGFLRLAVGISAALRELHAHGVVHRDVKPAHVLVDPATGGVTLTGFGIATRLLRERQAPAPPEVLAGTLAYMAPEQTGRMNRSVDARSDLYSLGVTLYEMATGALPFTASEPLEWVHCHVARRPVPPAERVRAIPATVSAIVETLLAKTPEARYQTAAGVEYDLRRCLAEWEAGGGVGVFPLRERDTPDQLLIPETLYGREREVDALLAAFDRVVASGAAELVLVTGYAGVGKSSVVAELHKALVSARGLFAAGKFDQYKRDVPYATVAQAVQGLVRSLLAKSDCELARWRDVLREALGPNGQLMVDLVPELGLVIGDQTPVPELPPQDAQRRYQLVLRRFLAVFARPEHPLALFLDDLQWLDPATLDLLEDLLTQTDVRHLLLIGAYRDNEVTFAHPLMRRLEAIRATRVPVHEIALAPLGSEDVRRLVADALHCDGERAAPLAHLVHEKTAGNPFFTIQFLSALVEEGLVTFDHSETRWRWELPRIHAKGYTANVVDLMVKKLSRLPADTQRALRQLACLGNSAESGVLAMVYEDSREQLAHDLQHALRSGLVVRSEGGYRFLHDRVQEAAYSLIPEAQRAEVHLRIGRLLAAHTPPEKREEAIFEIVNQLNRGAVLIRSRAETEQLAELNLIAGKRARASTAYASALNYLVAGAELLPDGWDHRPDLMFALEFHRAECEVLTGELRVAEERLAMLSGRAGSMSDRAAVACSRVDLYTNLDRAERAVAVGLEFLQSVGVTWSAYPTDEEVSAEYGRIWENLGSRPVEDLLELPPMTDAACCATLDVLTSLQGPAHFIGGNLVPLLIGRMANLSLEHGNAAGSCFAYVYLGMILESRFGDYARGLRFGKLGVDLLEKKGLDRFRARVYNNFGMAINPWANHARTSVDLLRRANDAAREAGDVTFVGYSYTNLISARLIAGDALSEVQKEAETAVEILQRARFGTAVDMVLPQLGLIRALRGVTGHAWTVDRLELDESWYERHLDDPGLTMPACWYWIRKMQRCYAAGSHAAAVAAATRAESLLWTSPTFIVMADYHFYAALVRVAQYEGASTEERHGIRTVLERHRRLLTVWADHCPDTFANRAALVGAEIARIDGRALDAERLYEEAIRSARENGFVHNEALANELAARFHAARGLETIAHAYLRNARRGYLRWGADGKVRQLDELHPHLRADESGAARAGTIDAPVERLDLATVIAVSQAVSGEMVLEKLLDTVMRTAIEYAGAERAVLMLSRGAGQRIAAEATTVDDTVAVRLCDEPVTGSRLPEAVLRYVLHTRESVILDDAAGLNPFSTDPYLGQRRARSVICLPLTNQAKLIGVLYLENNLAPRVFAPARAAVLKLLASQAAISLENTRLYRELADREARIRRLVDANIVGIFIWELDGGILEANEAFLAMVGYGRDDLAAGRLRWTELIPGELRERVERLWLTELRVSGSLRPTEIEYLRKDGGRVPVLVGGASFEDAAHQGVAFVVDLTERRRAEQAVRERERESRQILDTIPGLVAVLTPTGEVDAVNNEIVAFCGQPLEAMKEWGTNGTIHPEDLPHMVPIFVRAIASGEPYDFEARVRRFDGVYRWLQIRGLPLRDTSGRIGRWYVLLSDVDDRKRAEDAIANARSELARAARVMTLSALTASIAHEVSQPLSGIMTNASTSLRMLDALSPNIEGARETARRTIRDAKRASDVITRLRAMFSKREFTPESMDLNEATREVVALSLSDLQRNRVSLQLELAEPLPPIMGDRIQLQQVLLNLLRNASEAMTEVDDRPRQLLVRTEPEGDARVRVTVRDAGVGLDRQSLDKLFDAFYTTKHGGMGIGLSVSRSIIERHHGRMWAEPNDGPGATFAFSIPRGGGTAEGVEPLTGGPIESP
jgi:PAS domain S-box-containing protein